MKNETIKRMLIGLAIFWVIIGQAVGPLASTSVAETGLQIVPTATGANLYMPGCPQLGGGLGSSGSPGYCAYSDFGYMSCPAGNTCPIPLSLIPSGYKGDVWVWMWCASPWTYDCQILNLGPSPPTIVAVNHYGSTYSELSARWWQWLLSIPAAVNPNLDPTGANCALEQHDDVWFLAGGFGGTIERSCTIPAGKPIFFPLVNNIAFKPNGKETLLDLRELASLFIDSVAEIECKMDNVACFEDRSEFRVRSPSFTVIAPPKGLVPPGQLTLPGNTDSIVSDGYWLLLEPPDPGSHKIHFKVTAGEFLLDVTYNLTVEE
jgi:hypothetical protein